MPTGEEIQNMFSKFGDQVSNAFIQPATIKLQVAEMRKKLNDEQELKQKKEVAAGLLSKTYGPEAGAFYSAGGDLSDLAAMKKAYREGSGGGGGAAAAKAQDYAESFNLLNAANSFQQNILDDHINKVAESAGQTGMAPSEAAAVKTAMAKGVQQGQQAPTTEQKNNASDLASNMDKFNSVYEVAGEKLTNNVEAFQKVVKGSAAMQGYYKTNEVLATRSPDMVNGFVDALTESVRNSKIISGKTLDSMAASQEKYGVNLKGLPSAANIEKMAAVLHYKMNVPLDALKTIVEAPTAKLRELANDERAPQALRDFTASVFMANKVSGGFNFYNAKSAKQVYDESQVQAPATQPESVIKQPKRRR